MSKSDITVETYDKKVGCKVVIPKIEWEKMSNKFKGQLHHNMKEEICRVILNDIQGKLEDDLLFKASSPIGKVYEFDKRRREIEQLICHLKFSGGRYEANGAIVVLRSVISKLNYIPQLEE